ncbi:MAG: M48 family metallopeptidase [Lachnospiraceae bacterium]|nr:M48 family metallopeptidase [Lachnospiraceae bacterium]
MAENNSNNSDNTLKIEVIRSKRKTISLEVKGDGRVIVRCPLRTSSEKIKSFVDSKWNWIVEKYAKAKAINEFAKANNIGPQSEEDIMKLKEAAKKYIPGRVKYFAPLVGVDYGKITIKHQKTMWGSCSSLGNLNFNCLLMLVPPDVLDYVVVHELTHRRHMDHSKEFWEDVGRIIPDYREKEAWLKTNGRLLQ